MNACESLGIHLEERGARRVGRRQGGSYLHAPDRMPEKSRHDLPRRPFTWSRIMTSTLSARSISSGFEVRLDPAARAAGPCASPRGDCQWSGGHSTGRGRKPGGGKRTDERGLFLLCRSRVRVMVGRRLSDARADEPTSIDGKARTWRLRPS